MSLLEHYDRAVEDLRSSELSAFHSHLVGGLLQGIESGDRHAGKDSAAAAIDRARTFATRDRVKA